MPSKIVSSIFLLVFCVCATRTSSSKRVDELTIVYEGIQLVNNSLIRVSEGNPLVLNCALDVATVGSGSSNQVTALSESSKQFKWLDDNNRIISYNQKLELPSIYSDTISRLKKFGCGLQGPTNTLPLSYVIVKVMKPPSFTITRVPAFGIPVLEGMTVLLTCDIDLEDEVESRESNGPKWMKDEEPLRSNVKMGTVTIMSVGLDDIGWYQCYTDVREETFSSIGYFLNVIPKSEIEIEDEKSIDEALEIDDDDELESEKELAHSINEDDDMMKVNQGLKNVQRVASNVVYEDGGTASNCSCCQHIKEATSGGKRRHHYPLSSPHQLYKEPVVKPLNHSKIVLHHPGSKLTLSMEICSNPKAHKMLWITPDSRAIGAGQTVANYQHKVVLSQEKVTCEQAHLDISLNDGYLASTQEGEYILIAKNHHGLSEAHIIIRNPKKVRNSYAQRKTSASSSPLNPSLSNFICLLLVIMLN